MLFSIANKTPRRCYGSAMLLTVALAGCGGSSNNNAAFVTSSDTSLSGTAAIGAPIVNGTITAKCADGSGFVESPVNSDASGNWQATINDADALPCALQISGGSPAVTLHSYAATAGVINITPLTDLIIAEQTAQMPQDWFAGFDGSATIDINDTALPDALTTAGFAVPAGNAFMTAFAADGNGWDGLLDDLQQAIDDDIDLTDYAALLTLIKDGNLASSIPAAPVREDGTCGGNADGTSELPSGNDLISTCAGTYNIAFMQDDASHARGTITIGTDNSIDFDDGIVFNAADINVVYDRISCCNRIEIWYDNGDKIFLFRTDKGKLRNVHYQPDEGSKKYASLLPQLPAGDGERSSLTESNQIVFGTVNGEPKIQETVFGTKPPISGSSTFEVRGQSHQATVPETIWTLTDIPAEVGTHYCKPYFANLQITYLRNVDSGAAQSGGGDNAIGRCTVTVLDIQFENDSLVGAKGSFAVELLSFGPDGTGNLVDIVTDGYFHYFPE